MKATGSELNVSIADWAYGSAASELSYDDYYDGEPTILYTGITLLGADYSSSETPENAGSYTVTVTYSNGQTGSADFTISPHDLTKNVVLQPAAMTYNGTEQTLTHITLNYTKTMTLGQDFTVTGGSGTSAGIYTATVTGIGNYTGND